MRIEWSTGSKGNLLLTHVCRNWCATCGRARRWTPTRTRCPACSGEYAALLPWATSPPGFARLMAAAQAMLREPTRGGRGNKSATEIIDSRVGSYSKTSVPMWLEVLEENDRRLRPTQASRRKVLSTGDKAKTPYSRARRLLDDGMPGKAVGALRDAGVHELDDATIEKLRQLHPQRPQLDQDTTAWTALRTAAESAHAVAATQGAVKDAVRSFSKETSPGPTLFSALHLRDILSADAGALELALTGFVNKVLRGELERSLWPFFGAARGVPLKKPDGGVRPIAVGETLRRLVGKVLVRAVKPKVLAYFEPMQKAMSAGGTEAIIHWGRNLAMQWHASGSDAATSATPPKIGIKWDMKNAFNSISRVAMLRGVLEVVPEALPYLFRLYEQAQHLVVLGSTVERPWVQIPVVTGTQQGDPVGPMLFSLGLHAVLRLIVAKHPTLGVEGIRALMDDVTAFADATTLFAVHCDLKRMCKAIGLELNLKKCELVGPARLLRDDQLEWSRLLRSGHVGPGTEFLTPEALAWPADIVRAGHNFNLLGAPIGDDAFVLGTVRAIIEKNIRPAAAKLAAWGDEPHAAFYLLKLCTNVAPMTYVMRTVPPSQTARGLAEYSAYMRDSVEKIVGRKLTEAGWLQATLPMAKGGLGFSHAASLAPAAYIASAVSFAQAGLHALGMDDALALYAAQADGGLPASLAQRALSEGIHEARAKQLHRLVWSGATCEAQPAPEDELALRRALHATVCHATGSWAGALPCRHYGLDVTPVGFRTLVRFVLALGVTQNAFECPRCGKQADRLGCHASYCSSAASGAHKTAAVIGRHDAVRDHLAALSRRGQVTTKVEQRFTSPSNERAGDIVVRLGDQTVAIDVSVVTPFNDKALQRTIRGDFDGVFATRELEKEGQHAAACALASCAARTPRRARAPSMRAPRARRRARTLRHRQWPLSRRPNPRFSTIPLAGRGAMYRRMRAGARDATRATLTSHAARRNFAWPSANDARSQRAEGVLRPTSMARRRSSSSQSNHR